MYDELVKRLRNRRICIQQSGSLDDFPLLVEAADAIEELSLTADSYKRSMEEWAETAQEWEAAYSKEHNKRIAENRYLYDELTKAVKKIVLMTPIRIEVPQPQKEET